MNNRMILFKKCRIYTPEPVGVKDLLVAGGKIIAIEEEISIPSPLPVTVIEGKGLIMTPGLIDNHVHIAGAGGEGGPSTRTPELTLRQMIEAGVTTVIGSLGTDGMTRSVEAVLMKAKGLRAEGVSAWIMTGAYQVPTPTILGDVGKDIALIEEVIGVGEIALSDHRSSRPTIPELIRLVEHARVGGMLGGKAGIVCIHMGDAHDPFKPIHQAVAQSELQYTQFIPTHCNRNDEIFEQSKSYAKEGFVDITTSSYPYYPEYETKPSTALKELLESGVPEDHITFSSDGCGSLPDFDEEGNLVKLIAGEPSANLRELKECVMDEKIPLETALKVLTSNPARIFQLPGKGRIQPGMDADLLIMDDAFSIIHLVARGELFIHDGRTIKKGAFA